MAIYIDNARIEWRGRQWCHMVADSIEELHEFAKKLGMKRAWFQCSASYPHYDITVEVRAHALKLGALEGNRAQIITCARKLKSEQTKLKLSEPRQISLFD